ncbi:MAG: NAD(P)/FAD-dependent oxidoreductase [Acetivibrio sp.]
MEDIIVIGAGASGLIAAIVCGRNGKKVTILEHNDKIGRKLLATGNGKCNFTNDCQDKEAYRSQNLSLAFDLIKQYDKSAYLAFLESIGMYPKNKNGYYYPYSEQAVSMVNALRLELERLKIKVKLREHVEKVLSFQKEDGSTFYQVVTKTYTYETQKVILSCGGKAAGSLGSDGSGYRIAKELGHSITPLVPALTGLKTEEIYGKKLAGIRCQADILLETDGIMEGEASGEIQFTSYGISGIPVFQVSRFAGMALLDKKEVFAILRLFPDLSQQDLLVHMLHYKECFPKATVVQALEPLMDRKMAEALCMKVNLKKEVCSGDLKKNHMENLSSLIKNWRMKIIESNSFEQAQVTAGGVSMLEVEKDSLESKKKKGIYFTGELLDVDGTCGGYNLQWAFSSAYAVGMNAGRK